MKLRYKIRANKKMQEDMTDLTVTDVIFMVKNDYLVFKTSKKLNVITEFNNYHKRTNLPPNIHDYVAIDTVATKEFITYELEGKFFDSMALVNGIKGRKIHDIQAFHTIMNLIGVNTVYMEPDYYIDNHNLHITDVTRLLDIEEIVIEVDAIIKPSYLCPDNGYENPLMRIRHMKNKTQIIILADACAGCKIALLKD